MSTHRARPHSLAALLSDGQRSVRRRLGFLVRALVARRLARLGFRRIPPPPEYLAGGVGTGDFETTGRELVELAKRFASLGPRDRILDLGCGLGRVAQPLREYLGPRGRYDGVDVVSKYVEWDTMMIEGRDPRFRFHHIDAENSEYNPRGRVRAETVRLPFAAEIFTFVLATSLFTHLVERATCNYLREVARVLEPGGRFFGTFFLLDREVDAQMARGRTDLRFRFGESASRFVDREVPERAVAFQKQWLMEQLRAAGFARIESPVRGAWTGFPGSPGYHDLVVATR